MIRCPIVCSSHVWVNSRQNAGDQDREVPERDPVDAGEVAGRDEAVDRLLHQVGLRELQHRVGDDGRQRQRRLEPVRPQVPQQAPHQARVVRFSDYVVVVVDMDSRVEAVSRRAVAGGSRTAPTTPAAPPRVAASVHRRVQAVAGDERVVRAALDDAAVVEHEDLVGVADGRDAVRHDDRRPLAHDAAQPRRGSPPRSRCPPPRARRRESGSPDRPPPRARAPCAASARPTA